MPIRIPIIADVVDAIRGARNLGESFDDVSDALEDVEHDARAATRPVEEVGRAASGTTRDADQLERSFRDAFDTVRREADTAGAGVGTSMHRGTTEASEGVHEMGNEAASTSAEVAASFDGSAESIAGGFQELAANAFAGFGPAGAAAGVAAAAGIGILMSSLQKAADEANALTEDAVELSHTLGNPEMVSRSAELADRWEELAGSISDAKSWFEVWQPRAVTNIEQFGRAASNAGLDVGEMFQAFTDPDTARGLERLSDLLVTAKAKQKELTDEIAAHSSPRYKENAQAVIDDRLAVDEFVSSLDTEIRTREAAAAITAANAKAHGQSVEQYEAERVATEKSTEAQEAYQDAIKDSADSVSVYEDILSDKTEDMRAAAQQHADDTIEATGEAADSWEDYATAVTVTTDDLIAEWNRQADEAAAFQTNLAEIAAAGGQALADELRAKGPEVASAVAATIAAADPAVQQTAIEAHARATGEEMGKSMATGVGSQKPALQGAVDTLASQITTPWLPVKLVPDTKDLDRELAKPRSVPVNVTPWFSGSGFRTV